MLSAVSSSLLGVSAAQDQLDVAAASVARGDLPGASSGGDDLVDAATGASGAQLQQSVSLAMLKRAMDAEQSLVNVFA
jgi:hypothetical protein